MTTYNVTIKKRNPSNDGWDTILPITTGENVIINAQGDTIIKAIDEKIPANEKGEPEGVATLDEEGNVPEEQLGNIRFPEVDAPTQAEFESHATRHEADGDDEISIEGLEGESAELKAYKLTKIHQEEIHGLRVNPQTDEFEYFDGEEWKRITVNAQQIRDNPGLNLRFRVSDTAPAAIDGRVYYDTVDKLFYVARNGQWWRIYVGGDEKIEQNAPTSAPQLDSRTDTTIKLVADSDMEYMYQGGDWQESSLFAGLSRNTEYTFYSRYKETEIYKASPPSPSAKYTTDKGTQTAPAAPTVSAIEWDRATVTGASGTEVRVGAGTWYDSPHTFTGLTENTTYQAYARYKETTTHYASPASAAKSFKTPLRVPGPATLIAGTMQAGFFGEVSASELIAGDALATQCGISQGTGQNSTAGWLKFAWQNKILFVAKKPIRNSISWDAINTAKCVYGNSGDKQIVIDGLTYKVRLLRGADLKFNPKTPIKDQSGGGNGYNGAICYNSEWNRLMLPIHQEAISKNWAYPDNVESDIPVWAHSLGNGTQSRYTDEDLLTKSDYGSGSYSWCQEMAESTASRVPRGYYGVSYSYSYTSSITNSLRGWRPCLEFVS